MRERGWGKAGAAYNTLRALKFHPLRRALSLSLDGLREDGSQRIRAKLAWWAPAWAVDVAQLELPRAEVAQLIRDGATECQRVVVLHRLRGKRRPAQKS